MEKRGKTADTNFCKFFQTDFAGGKFSGFYWGGIKKI